MFSFQEKGSGVSSVGLEAANFGVFRELRGRDAADDGIEQPIDGALADDPGGVLGRDGGGRLEAAVEGQVGRD